MMKRIFVELTYILFLVIPLSAQSSRLIKELESKRGELQKQIADTESLLKNTKKDVGSQLNSLASLTGPIQDRTLYSLALKNAGRLLNANCLSLRDSFVHFSVTYRTRKRNMNLPSNTSIVINR